MANIRWKYILFLAGVVGLYLVLAYLMPRRFDWSVTLSQKDKNPFGTYLLRTLLDRSWFDEINTSYRTVFELNETPEPNMLILAEVVNLNESEADSLLKRAEKGNHIYIATHALPDEINKLFGCKINPHSFSFLLEQVWGRDSTGIRFVSSPFDTTTTYWLPSMLLTQYFESFDSTIYKVLAINTNNKPVLLQRKTSKGSFMLSSTPLMFSNFSMLRQSNSDFIASLLSHSNDGPLLWTEYYQLGRMESGSPLRYILSVPALTWALYLTLLIVLLVMIFGARRRQRIIPVIEPAKNETLQFVKTIANLYYNRKDHRGLALKKILHFTEFMKNQLRIDPGEDILEVVQLVAAKTGTNATDVRNIFNEIHKIQSSNYLSAGSLVEFVGRIDKIIQNFQAKT